MRGQEAGKVLRCTKPNYKIVGAIFNTKVSLHELLSSEIWYKYKPCKEASDILAQQTVSKKQSLRREDEGVMLSSILHISRSSISTFGMAMCMGVDVSRLVAYRRTRARQARYGVALAPRQRTVNNEPKFPQSRGLSSFHTLIANHMWYRCTIVVFFALTSEGFH